jgi:hypothetical protein
LGSENEGVIEINDIYFPEDQDEKAGYISPEALGRYK